MLINDTRQNSVKKLLRRYELEPTHAEQVRKLSLIIFDKTRGLIHNMSDNERDLLEAGAILHDIGYYVSAKSHHKNAHKLILQDKLEGFSPTETEIIANIARYHKGRLPDKKHESYMSLSSRDRSIVNKLAAFLRMADALDRTHCAVVNDLDFALDGEARILTVTLKLESPTCYFEICKAQDKKDLFQKVFGIEAMFIVG